MNDLVIHLVSLVCHFSSQCSHQIFYALPSKASFNKVIQTPTPKASPIIHTHPFTGPYFPIVKNNLSPTSPKPGLIIPLSLTFSSSPATQISVPSGHSLAALNTPGSAPNTVTTIILLTPHSLSVCIAAAHVPPVAMTGSRSKASSEALVLGVLDGELAAGRWYGRLL